MEGKIKSIRRNVKYFFKYKVKDRLNHNLIDKINSKKPVTRYLIKISLVVSICFVLASVLNLFLPWNFVSLLRVSALVVFVLCALSVLGILGDSNSTSQKDYATSVAFGGCMYSKPSFVGSSNLTLVFGTSTVVLYLISLIF